MEKNIKVLFKELCKCLNNLAISLVGEAIKRLNICAFGVVMEKKKKAEKAAEEKEKAAAEENTAGGMEGTPEKKGEKCNEDAPEKTGENWEKDAPEEKPEDIKETLQRVQAEFENSRKRLEREKQDFAAIANAGLVRALLPLLDSIDAAEKHLEGQENASKQDALKGMELVKKQLLAVLRAHGLREIECIGKVFDPMTGDCVMQGKEKGKEDNIVLEELQKGYALNGKVLRHAKVKVNHL